MPVIGVPIPSGGGSGTVPGDVTARTTQIYGVPAVERLKSLRVIAAQAATIDWTMVDEDGAPVDLSDWIPPGTVSLRAIEAVAGRAPASFDATVTDPAGGTVQVIVDATQFVLPGIYLAEFAVLDSNGGALYSNRLYLVVEASLFGGCATDGPPSIPEIRLALRSSSPAENRLLDNVTFDNAEIAQALRWPVQYFNETQPPIQQTFDTNSFPFRYHWSRGAAAILFSMLAEYYRQNQLAYGAGGVSVDDYNKAPLYEAVYDKYWNEFTSWARSQKAVMSQNECWGSSPSPYAWGYTMNGGGSWNYY